MKDLRKTTMTQRSFLTLTLSVALLVPEGAQSFVQTPVQVLSRSLVVEVQNLPGEVIVIEEEEDTSASDEAVTESRERRSRRKFTRSPKSVPPVEAVLPVAAPVEEENTQRVVDMIDENDTACDALPSSYTIDCLSAGYRDLADRLPAGTQYAEVRSALDQVARELDVIATRARDNAKPRRRVDITSRRGLPPRKLTDIVAVRTDREAAANAAARATLERSRLILLRSVPQGDARNVHFTRVAEAFDGSAVLLRS